MKTLIFVFLLITPIISSEINYEILKGKIIKDNLFRRRKGTLNCRNMNISEVRYYYMLSQKDSTEMSIDAFKDSLVSVGLNIGVHEKEPQ